MNKSEWQLVQDYRAWILFILVSLICIGGATAIVVCGADSLMDWIGGSFGIFFMVCISAFIFPIERRLDWKYFKSTPSEFEENQ